MKKTILFLLITLCYFLFCNMSCDVYDPVYEDEVDCVYEDKLLAVELTNIDFGGKEMVLVSNKAKKEAYVIGVQCFINSYKIETSINQSTEELLEENVLADDDKRIMNFDFDVITLYNFDEKHPAGSSVKDCFVKSYAKVEPLVGEFSYMLILRKVPLVGTHSFKIVYKQKSENAQVLKTTEDVIEAVTEPIELY